MAQRTTDQIIFARARMLAAEKLLTFAHAVELAAGGLPHNFATFDALDYVRNVHSNADKRQEIIDKLAHVIAAELAKDATEYASKKWTEIHGGDE